MVSVTAIVFFAFGLIIGSFLNVVIFRHNTNKTFGGRSVCLNCSTEIAPRDLVPLLSYLILKGRCRNCETRISVQYPVVEFVTGLIFALLFLKLQSLFWADTLSFTLTYAYYATLFSILVVIATYDLKHKIIPDIFSGVFGALALIGLFLFTTSGFHPHIPTFAQFLSGIYIALPFALVWYFSGGTWMGFGDAKLALGLGWMLGTPAALSALVLSFWSGAIVGIILMIFSKNYKMKSEVPFAPFLVLGSLIAFLFNLYIFPSIYF